jgi:hypothetical protein
MKSGSAGLSLLNKVLQLHLVQEYDLRNNKVKKPILIFMLFYLHAPNVKFFAILHLVLVCRVYSGGRAVAAYV